MNDFPRTLMSDWKVLIVVGVVLGEALGLAPAPAKAQMESFSVANALTSEERPIRVALRPAYQRFEDEGRTLTQWSVPLQVMIPFREQWQLRIQGSVASAGGKGLAELSGLTDIRTTLSYARSVGKGSVILSAGVTAPTGKQELTQDEFMTATLLSQNFYRFHVPSFGQGVGARAGATWAVPVGESVVIGLGASVRYYGSYDPVAGREARYDPGEEGRITGGIDFKLTRTSALSGEVTLFVYGTDTVGGVDQFTAGNQISVRVRYLRRRRGRTLRIVGRYQGREKSTLSLRNGMKQELQVLPTEGTLWGRFTTPVTEAVGLRVSAAGRWYGETTAFESKTLATIGAGPRFEIGERLVISPRVAYTTGSVRGLEGTLALVVRR